MQGHAQRTTDGYKTRVQDLFDSRSKKYDVKNDFHPPLSQQLVDISGIAAGSEVLDVCCGTGLVALNAAQAVGRSGRVVGVDITQSMLDQAISKMDSVAAEVVSFLCADAETVQFPEESFSHLLISSGMAYLDDIPAAAAQFRKWLKPCGVLAFNNPLAPMIPLTAVIIDLAEAHFGAKLTDAGTKLGSRDRILTVLKTAGFGDIQVTETAEEFVKSCCTPQQYAESIFKMMETFPTTPMSSQLDCDQIEELRSMYMPLAIQQAESWTSGGDIVVPYTMLWAKALVK